MSSERRPSWVRAPMKWRDIGDWNLCPGVHSQNENCDKTYQILVECVGMQHVSPWRKLRDSPIYFFDGLVELQRRAKDKVIGSSLLQKNFWNPKNRKCYSYVMLEATYERLKAFLQKKKRWLTP